MNCFSRSSVGSGSVIFALHHAYHETHSHEDAQDMRNMGGLMRYMPWTGTLMWIRERKDHPRFNYLGGVQLLAIKPENKWTLMDYAFEGWGKDGK